MMGTDDGIFRLNVECQADGMSLCTIRVPINGKERVKKLLEAVRERASCRALTALFAVRGDTEALLNPEDLVWQTLDKNDTFLKARSGGAMPDDSILVEETEDPQEATEYELVQVHQRYTADGAEGRTFPTLSVEPGDAVEMSSVGDRGWVCCRKDGTVAWVARLDT